jgi:outer membrane protein OmpA-like peptidoglycan-associated protein
MAYDSYDSYESRSTFGLMALVAIVAICGVMLFVLARFFTTSDENAGGAGGNSEEAEEAVRVTGKLSDPPDHKSTVPETSAQILESLGIGVSAADPALLVEQIGRNLEAGQVWAAANIIGRKALSEGQFDQLHKLAAEARLKLNMEDDYGSRIYFDLLRKQGKWAVQKVVLPKAVVDGETPRAVLVDALGITDAFLQAALKQSFETAKSFVNSNEVSDAKIAGLCIVFEEGQYQLRAKKPLRAVFNRDNTAAFLANVETHDGAAAAQFGVNVQRKDENSPWRVTEINLDQLLADYAQRVAGGDVYFTPLIRNPGGGDTLILYFGFDEETLSARTQRQLEIVSLLLQTDAGKELTLSGHTDAIGSEAYNKGLSGRRAETVRNFLVDSGVDPKQIKTVALGKSKPRRPNTTETGEDNPAGRRVNRRTEIYLDF